jgi:hypothetical protein
MKAGKGRLSEFIDLYLKGKNEEVEEFGTAENGAVEVDPGDIHITGALEKELASEGDQVEHSWAENALAALNRNPPLSTVDPVETVEGVVLLRAAPVWPQDASGNGVGEKVGGFNRPLHTQ